MALALVRAATDSSVYYDVIKEPISLETIYEEVKFQTMHINGKELCRPGAFQATISEDGSIPWLRCPSAEGLIVNPFTPTIKMIRDRLSNKFNVDLNHVKIQIYKDEKSYIKPHSDKTLDIVANSPIINYRIGSTRMFSLINKQDKQEIETPMLNNSVFVLGPETNKQWRHYVNPIPEKTGPSISMVFRCVHTFLTRPVYLSQGYLYGKGALYKTKEELEENLKNTHNLWDPVTFKTNLVKVFALENRDICSQDSDIYSDIIKNSLSLVSV